MSSWAFFFTSVTATRISVGAVGVEAAQRHAAQDALGQQGVEHRARRAPEVQGEFVKPGGAVAQLDALDLGQLAGQVVGLLCALGRHFSQALRAHGAEVNGRRQGQQGLVGADVAVGLLTADVLLAGLQGQHEAALAAVVLGHAADAAGHLAHQGHLGGQKAQVGPAKAGRNAQALALAAGDVGPKFAGALHQGQADRLDHGDAERALGMGRAGERRSVFQHAKEVGIAHHDGRGLFIHQGLQRLDVRPSVRAQGRDHDLGLEVDGVGLEHLQVLRMGAGRQDDAVAARLGLGHQAGLGHGVAALVEAGVAHVHPRQAADAALVLEDGLQHALGHLGLVGRVAGVELAAVEQVADDAGAVVVVNPRAQVSSPACRCSGSGLLRRWKLVLQLHLGQVGGQVQGLLQAQAFRGWARRGLVDAGHANGGQHGLLIGRGLGQVGVLKGHQIFHAAAQAAALSTARGKFFLVVIFSAELVVGGSVQQVALIAGDSRSASAASPCRRDRRPGCCSR